MKPIPKTIIEKRDVYAPGYLRLFNEEIRPQLSDTFNNAGRGRDGEEDGWINGLRLKRFHGDELANLNRVLLNAVTMVNPKPEIEQVLFNVMQGKSELKRHVDGAPYFDRWHLVLQSEGSRYWQEGQGYIDMQAGYWYGPISYWVPHAMSNTGEGERIHMIVDLGPAQ